MSDSGTETKGESAEVKNVEMEVMETKDSLTKKEHLLNSLDPRESERFLNIGALSSSIEARLQTLKAREKSFILLANGSTRLMGHFYNRKLLQRHFAIWTKLKDTVFADVCHNRLIPVLRQMQGRSLLRKFLTEWRRVVDKAAVENARMKEGIEVEQRKASEVTLEEQRDSSDLLLQELRKSSNVLLEEQRKSSNVLLEEQRKSLELLLQVGSIQLCTHDSLQQQIWLYLCCLAKNIFEYLSPILTQTCQEGMGFSASENHRRVLNIHSLSCR